MQELNELHLSLIASIEHDLKAVEERAKHFVASEHQ